MAQYELYYYDTAGSAEVCRLALWLADMKFENKNIREEARDLLNPLRFDRAKVSTLKFSIKKNYLS